MKASGSVESLLQGVSQQDPQDRGAGQHTEQVNMIPDPVRGLSRRHGTLWQAEQVLSNDFTAYSSMVEDTLTFRTFKYSSDDHDYVILYRAGPIGIGSPLGPIVVYDSTTNKFLPVNRNAVDPALETMLFGGISAIAAVGKYVFMTGYNNRSILTSTNLWTAPDNAASSVVWIRGGSYSRTFTVTATRMDGVVFTFSYTTPTSSYTGTLDTTTVPVFAADPAGGTQVDTEAAYIPATGIAKLGWAAWAPTGLTAKKGASAMTNVYPAAPVGTLQFSWAPGGAAVTFDVGNVGALDVTMTYTHTKTVSNPNFSKNISDLTNAFNSAVTNWIGSAATAVAPDKIAEQLRLAAVAAGLTTATRVGSTIIFDNVKALTVTDGGDGTLIRGVAQEVTSATQLSDIHKVGKIVRVRAASSAESYYLKATSRNPLVTSGYTDVTWVEGTSVENSISNLFVYLTVSNGQAYIAGSAALLNAILPGTHPDYIKSSVGDSDSSPVPYFVGRQITYLGVFQDRLIVGADAVVRASRIGDYLNFFRTSVLTVVEDDSLEVMSQGSEDDVMRHSVVYARDLVIFGDKRQYVLSGRSPITPVTPNLSILSSHPNAGQMPPLAVGGRIFYGQSGERGSSVFQIQPGIVEDSPESFIISSQLDSYLEGSLIEFCSNSKPANLLARSSINRTSIFCFSYIDKAQGRAQDAWHKLSFHPDLGVVMGMSQTPSGVMVFFLRRATGLDGVTRVYVVADFLSFTTGLSTKPYLDSMRPLGTVQSGATSVHENSGGNWKCAFDNSTQWRFIGAPMTQLNQLISDFPLATGAWVGMDQSGAFTPTNPFIKDRLGKTIIDGQLIVTSMKVTTRESSGFVATITSNNRQSSESIEYNTVPIGGVGTALGVETLNDATTTIPIALEARDYTLSINVRSWLPLTITNLEWVGQWFKRTPRI